ncbi:MAG TPA: glycosyltransferase family 4 protein [Terriglobales bacterium]|nr:glycosyltransferase family 4 protein [Terriglobales bacterium]
MPAVKILVESLADEDLTNAQMVNAREIIRRLDPERFHVSTFAHGAADPAVSKRPNTRVVLLPARRQTPRILARFFLGDHDILFYVKASPASRWYMSGRKTWERKRRVSIGTIESQSNWRSEPSISAENIALIEQTVLRCDRLFSNSSAVRRSLEKEYGIGSEVVPTGVDTQFFSPDANKAPNQRLRVLFVGALRPFKGPDLILEAAARCPGMEFVMVGDGPMREALQTRSVQLCNVRLLGTLNRNELRDEYRRADVFLFPSRWEGSPKVIMEAAACGLPVIARRDYEPETVIDGETGFLVGEDEELYTSVMLLAQSAALRARMGRAGRAHVAKFDWDNIARQWEQIFLESVANTKRALD